MIEPLSDLPAGVLGFRASGKVTAEDYETTLTPALERALERGGKVRLVYELGGDYEGFEAGGVWQDLRLGATHFTSFERVALVTEIDWLRHAASTLSFLMPGEVRVFGLGDRAEAARWAAGEA